MQIRNLQTGLTDTVSELSARPVLPMRIQWSSLPMRWTPDSRSLLFVEQQSPDRFTIRRYRIESGLDPLPSALAKAGHRIRGIYVSADPRDFAYLRWSGDENYAIHVVDLATLKDVEWVKVPGVPGTPFQSVSVAGRTESDDSMIVLRKLKPGTAPNSIEVLRVAKSGRISKVAIIENVFDRTPHLDPRRSLLYLICMDGLVQNVCQLSLGTGKMRQITDNQAPNVSFSGIRAFRMGRSCSRVTSGPKTSGSSAGHVNLLAADRVGRLVPRFVLFPPVATDVRLSAARSPASPSRLHHPSALPGRPSVHQSHSRVRRNCHG